MTGGNATYVNKIAKAFTLLGGMDYEREAPRRDDLDHYNFYNHAASSYYGPFVKIAGNNVTIAPVTPYVAGEGELGKYVHYYLGLRRDVILIDNDSFSISNQYVNIPAYSSSMWVGVNSPKATITIVPRGIVVRSADRVQLWQVVLHGRSADRRGNGDRHQFSASHGQSGRDRALISVSGK